MAHKKFLLYLNCVQLLLLALSHIYSGKEQLIWWYPNTLEASTGSPEDCAAIELGTVLRCTA